jgi:hypothetical protein
MKCLILVRGRKSLAQSIYFGRPKEKGCNPGSEKVLSEKKRNEPAILFISAVHQRFN